VQAPETERRIYRSMQQESGRIGIAPCIRSLNVSVKRRAFSGQVSERTLLSRLIPLIHGLYISLFLCLCRVRTGCPLRPRPGRVERGRPHVCAVDKEQFSREGGTKLLQACFFFNFHLSGEVEPGVGDFPIW